MAAHPWGYEIPPLESICLWGWSVWWLPAFGTSLVVGNAGGSGQLETLMPARNIV
jgi:hypothetical protein